MSPQSAELSRRHAGLRRAIVCALTTAAGVVGLIGGAPARADDHPVFLQWFETRWTTIEYRVPDFFMAGYDSTWLPPPSKAADTTSPGYDVFDRFDLGSPGAETAYGTQEQLRAMVEELHQTSSLVYFDIILNHNSGRNNSNSFFNAGGYPGLALRVGTDFWGDFHDGTSQSIDPGGANYDLWTGDLLSLIDIAQEKNYQYIRQPVGPNALNIPPGTVRNRPDAGNARFYPDRNLTPLTFNNAALPTGQQSVTIYPYNLVDPTQGDAITENATGYLTRWVQWMVEVIKADGFRLDAAKHIPQWFWNQYFDSSVFNRRKTFGGNPATPFSFGEIVDSNTFTQTYTRKDGFGNRDALDLNGAGQLRDILNARGFGSWDNVLFAHLDTVDGGGDTANSFGNNGSLGLNHVFSHDNGSAGNGGSPPPLPAPNMYALPEWAYLLFRPGPANVYYNSREFIDRYQFRGFWPREGNPTALGTEGAGTNPDLTRLVRLSDQYARGEWRIVNYTDGANTSRADVLAFERRKAGGGAANVLVGVNDSYASGVAFRSVQTSFPAGTRLHELTGNHGDAVVDPANQIPELLVVDGSQRVLLPVPYNQNASGVQHHKGYVVYGPATPTGALQIVHTDGSAFATQFGADPSTVPAYRRRLTTIPVVDSAQFEIRLTTNKTDPTDPDWDDFACFRIDGGFPSAGAATDFNGQNNGPDFADTDPYIPRYESFVTQASPLATTVGASNGVYRQTINTSSLSEGLHYIKIVAFRRRPAGTDPLFADFRAVIYVDRSAPAVALADAAAPIATPINTFRVIAADRTTNRVHILVNPPAGDPLAMLSASNQAAQYDRFEYRRTVGGLTFGSNTVVAVAFEPSGRSSVTTYTVNVTVGSGDVNHDSRITIDDLYLAFQRLISGPYDAAADLDANGSLSTNDTRILENSLRGAEIQNMAVPLR
jgi:hypothetical protein